MKKVVKFLLGIALLLALAVVAPGKAEAGLSIANSPSLSVARESSLSHVTLGWSPIDNVTGYQVYMKEFHASKFSKLATVKGGACLTYVTKSLESSTYSFKVRAYKTKNGKTTYSPFSQVKTVETGIVDYSEFGIGYPTTNDELSHLMTMIGGMKKKSNATWSTFFAKGNGVTIGVNTKADYTKPFFRLKVSGNLGLYIGGIRCGYDKKTALSVSGGDFMSNDGGKTFENMNAIQGDFVMTPTYDKNGVITQMVLDMYYSG